VSDDDIARLTYEEALAELDTLITRLEGGAVQLDEAIACYERGSRLAQRCAELLDRTEQAVMQLVVGGSGRLEERPLTPETEAPPADSGARGSGAPSEATPRPLVPPPPGAPLRARVAREQTPDPGLFPGLEPSSRPGARGADIDPDDIPF
jgi:exodeoxyribonuclease VII small subunit